MTVNERIHLITQNQTASYWLKNALAAAIARDVVDAARDAEVLAELLRARCDESLGRVAR